MRVECERGVGCGQKRQLEEPSIEGLFPRERHPHYRRNEKEDTVVLEDIDAHGGGPLSHLRVAARVELFRGHSGALPEASEIRVHHCARVGISLSTGAVCVYGLRCAGIGHVALQVLTTPRQSRGRAVLSLDRRMSLAENSSRWGRCPSSLVVAILALAAGACAARDSAD